MTTAYIALGSNEGDRLLNLGRAVDALTDLPDTRVIAVSHAYESEPAYVEDQPRFANAVAAIETDLESEQLLEHLQQHRGEHGAGARRRERPATDRSRHPVARRRGACRLKTSRSRILGCWSATSW